MNNNPSDINISGQPLITESEIERYFKEKELRRKEALEQQRRAEKEYKEHERFAAKAQAKPAGTLSVAKQTSILLTLIKFIILALVIFFATYLIVNYGAILAKVRYWWQVEYKNQAYQNEGYQQLTSNLFGPASAPQESTLEYVTDAENNRLVIGKIQVNVPIIWDVPADKILDELHNGVAHYQGTGHPGDVDYKNTFFTGHSSNYWWDKGQYNQVFALLDKLVAGDVIYVTYNHIKYTYKVEDAIVIKPNQVEVLQSSDKPILSLMTCVPVGTNLNRLIVKAVQISPEPGSLSAISSESSPTATPEISPEPTSTPTLAPTATPTPTAIISTPTPTSISTPTPTPSQEKPPFPWENIL